MQPDPPRSATSRCMRRLRWPRVTCSPVGPPGLAPIISATKLTFLRVTGRPPVPRTLIPIRRPSRPHGGRVVATSKTFGQLLADALSGPGGGYTAPSPRELAQALDVGLNTSERGPPSGVGAVPTRLQQPPGGSPSIEARIAEAERVLLNPNLSPRDATRIRQILGELQVGAPVGAPTVSSR